MFTALSAFAAEGSPDGVPRFNINSYHVQGNTLLANATIEAILAPFTGEAKDFGTVQEALDELEGAYHARGFAMVVVTLPEQELENGLIRLNVIESRIQKITMEGMRFFDGENILRSLPALRLGESPNIDNVSRSLKIANENPAKKINLQMLNSDKENEVDAKITVTDERPWKIGISGDNTGTRQTGPTRLGFLFQHANMFNRDHLLTLQYITSPEMLNNVSISSLGYRVPFYALGSSLDLIGAYSNVNSGTVSVGTANMAVSGKGTILGIHYNQNFTRIGNYEHKLTLGLDYRAFENNLDLVGIPLGNNVTVHPVSLTYAGTYNLENQIIAGFYMTALQNLPGSWDGRDTSADFEKARTGASGAYNMFRFGANMLYFLGDWQARAIFNGQYTLDPLVPGEQYGIGGATTVRGFGERQVANDLGYSGSAEIYTPDLTKMFGFTAIQSRALLFYDRGFVSRNNPAPGETVSTEIASFGPGIRVTDGKTFSFSADLGYVLDPPDDNTSSWSQVWHVSGSILF